MGTRAIDRRRGPGTGPGGRSLLRDLTVVVVAVAAYRYVDLARDHLDHADFIDLAVYRMGGRGILDGTPLYGLTHDVAALPFTYTPFAALVFVPVALLDPRPASIALLTVTAAALARACWLCARETRHRTGGAWPVALGAASLFLVAVDLEPVQATMRFGQINIVILWLVLEDVLRRRPARFGGALIGVATGIKLVPGLFVLLLLVTRRTREAVVATAAAAATVAVGFAVQPGQAWAYWTGIAYDPARVGGVAFISNQSVNGMLTRFTQPGGVKAAWAVAAVVLVAVGLWTARRLWASDAHLVAVAVVALVTLLVSPISWSHHWVWLIVVIAALFDPAAGPRALRLGAAVLTIVIALSEVIWSVPNTGDLEYAHDAGQRIWGNAYTWLALALLALFAWSAARSAPADDVAPGEPQAGLAAAPTAPVAQREAVDRRGSADPAGHRRGDPAAGAGVTAGSGPSDGGARNRQAPM